MFFSSHNHALVRAMLTGAIAVGGASACSHSDRGNAGRDSVQTGAVATPSDTGSTAAQSAAVGTGTPANDTAAPARAAPSVAKTAPSSPSATRRDSLSGEKGVSGYRAMAHDTSQPSNPSVNAAVVPGDSAMAGKPGERIEPTQASEQANQDTLATGDSTRIRPSEDSTELHGAVANDTATGVAAETGAPPAAADTSTAEPMARDTSTVLAQADTSARETPPADITGQADTTALSVSADTTASQTAADTMGQAEADSSTLHAQADTSAAETGDTLAANDGHIRPTEDSTEVLGQVTTDRAAAGQADTLPNERDRIRPPEDSTELHGQVNANRAKTEADQAAVGAASVGSTGNLATGSDAVALMTRQGERCKVKDPETSRDVQWDLAASPATLNPCGTGTMTLPRIQTGDEK